MLKGKTAIITGSGSGIGKAIAVLFAKRGANVVISDINSNAGDITKEQINAQGGVAAVYKTDVTSAESVRNLVSFTEMEFGRVDILVNNAGTDRKGAIWDLSEDTWDTLMNLNLKGVFLCTQAAVHGMRERRYGRIINISSSSGKTGEAYTSPYSATKFGVIGFTQSIALKLGASNITVNAVCPGPTDTELIRKSVEQSAALSNKSFEDEMYEKFLRSTPLGRLAQPDDIAKTVAFLASDDASFITGTTINVSGGMEMH